jgi:hypothetical protein
VLRRPKSNPAKMDTWAKEKFWGKKRGLTLRLQMSARESMTV